MPDTGRLLSFPSKACSVVLKPAEALELAEDFLAVPPQGRSDEQRSEAFSNPDVLLALLGSLERMRDTSPRVVFQEASTIYEWLKHAAPVGVFDERDYFVGQSAYLAGSTARLLGFPEEASRWLDRAESHFRHVLNPAPSMANVAYARLSLAFQAGRHMELLELMPSIRLSFERLGMGEETAKCLLLEAMTLKKLGKAPEALSLLDPIQASSVLSASLKGRILSEVGDLHQLEDRFEEAMSAYQLALESFETVEVSPGRADLKAFVGEAYRIRGKSDFALQAIRAAVADYLELGLENRVAYLRMYIADILLSLDRPREAEWEVLAALPTIEEQKMVPEGFAAVALLKESVRRRKTDPTALRKLREHLQASK